MAEKCFVKALQLEPCNAIAGPALADMYVLRAQIAMAYALYDTALASDPTAKWAWQRKGRMVLVG